MKKTKYLLATLIVLTFILMAVEVGLRMSGFRPGILLSPEELSINWVDFDKIESAEIDPNVFADNLGLMKITKQEFADNSSIIGRLLFDLKPSDFNQDGFRTQEISSKDSTKNRVLFIGDSFTFGFDANPFGSAFPDLIAQKKSNSLEVYNLGIGGADMLSYATVAENYLEKYQPDLIVLCLYTNDYVSYKKEMIPLELNNIFPSSAGVFQKVIPSTSSDSIIVFNNFKSVKDFFITKFTTFNIKNSWLNTLSRKSVLLTQIIGLNYDFEKHLNKSQYKQYLESNFTPLYFERIKKACQNYGVELVVTLIPDKQDLDSSSNIELFQQMIGNENYKLHFPSKIEMNHYGNFPFIHFNNSGHEFYANFLDAILEEKLKASYVSLEEVAEELNN